MAHVTLNPREANQGGFAKFDVRVPNERSDASTSQVEIQLPQDHPIANVSVAPVPGWRYEVVRRSVDPPLEVHGDKISEVVSTIAWSAEPGSAIKPGEFMEFPISVGPLPEDAERLVFKAVQTYDSGEVVRWIEEAGSDGKEPDHPAPVVKLVAAAGDHDEEEAEASPAAARRLRLRTRPPRAGQPWPSW